MSDNFSGDFLQTIAQLSEHISPQQVDELAAALAAVRDGGGRLFIIGSGGGAGHASHAVCDFRKLCNFEAYSPTDNVSELTARTNDDGWDTTISAWLQTSRLSGNDALLVFSVGGGSREPAVSMNLVQAVELAKSVGAKVFGVVGKPDGITAQLGDVCIVVDAPADRRTALVESYQAVIWHLLVFHPKLAVSAGKWESLETAPA